MTERRRNLYEGMGTDVPTLYDPVSTWIKLEECTLNLGPATSVEDNNTDTNEENSMDDSQDSDQGTN